MNAENKQFELRAKGAQAVGYPTEDGFVVRAGAIARKDVVPSGDKSVSPIRQRMIANGDLVEDSDGYRLVNDCHFNSPSGAAAVILGRTANGWIEWKTSEGESLSNITRVSRNRQGPLLDERTRDQFLAKHEQLSREGKLPARQLLEREYALFRDRFGPEVLAGADGEKLLSLMHDHANHKQNLVYWLEFKNDDEFDTRRFGSIAGGSALKFRIFRRKENGIWQAAGEHGNRLRDISTEEAIEIARSHRDQLLRGVTLLSDLPSGASDEEYAQLQDQMDEQAPDVSRLGWGHKYFSLLFPDKLDTYHTSEWQRFALLKLLQAPPDGPGRYICAGRLMSAAREVGMPFIHFDTVLTAIFGSRHRYWRIGTRSSETQTSHWPSMKANRCVAVGWPKLGELSWVEMTKSSRERLKSHLQATYPNHPSAIGNGVSQLVQFIADLAEGDIVLAADGVEILGIGRVTGGYRFESGAEFPHQRPVDWLDLNEWRFPQNEGLNSTIREVRRHVDNILEIERRIQRGSLTQPPLPEKKPMRLTGIIGRIQSVLDRKGQVILYGPPGTGKTYWAERAACDLAALSSFGEAFDLLDEAKKLSIIGNRNAPGLVRLCCFHPGYGYDDFLEGFRPVSEDGHLSFRLFDGVFKTLCRDAEEAPAKSFYLIVDEINRGDIPRIFGELLTGLEKDKRGKAIILPLSSERFVVPNNVFILGTMNTADRSISLLDAALRRRFGFIELMPDGAVLGESLVGGIPIRAWLEALNERIREHVGRDARNLQIGHSYLMHAGSPLKDIASLKRAIRDDIIPLLEEYCYEKFDTLGVILGEQIVDVGKACVRNELFEDGQEDRLVQGLLSAFDEISTSSEAISSEEAQATFAADEEPEQE